MASWATADSWLEELSEVEIVASLVVGEEICWVSEVWISLFTACGTIDAAAEGLEAGTVTVATQIVKTG